MVDMGLSIGLMCWLCCPYVYRLYFFVRLYGVCGLFYCSYVFLAVSVFCSCGFLGFPLCWIVLFRLCFPDISFVVFVVSKAFRIMVAIGFPYWYFLHFQ